MTEELNCGGAIVGHNYAKPAPLQHDFYRSEHGGFIVDAQDHELVFGHWVPFTAMNPEYSPELPTFKEQEVMS
jgi:hypothetical protein